MTCTFLTGFILRKTMNKTLVVNVRLLKYIKMYNKYIFKDKRYLVHNELNLGSIGQKIWIKKIRPISKHKHWCLI